MIPKPKANNLPITRKENIIRIRKCYQKRLLLVLPQVQKARLQYKHPLEQGQKTDSVDCVVLETT